MERAKRNREVSRIQVAKIGEVMMSELILIININEVGFSQFSVNPVISKHVLSPVTSTAGGFGQDGLVGWLRELKLEKYEELWLRWRLYLSC